MYNIIGMIEKLEIRQLEQIAEDATELCNVPFTLLSVLNEKTDKFEFKVLGGLTNPLLQSALRVGREATGIEFLGFSHATDVNRFIREIMQKKKFAFADIYTAAENILARPAIDAIQLILRIERLAVFPIIIKDRVKGLFGFISQRELNDKDFRLMQIFVNEVQLLFNNLLFNADLEDLVLSRTAELRVSLERFQTLVNALPEAVAATDSKGIITFASERNARLLGHPSASALLGQNAFELIAPDQREKARKNMEIIAQTKQATREKFEVVKADGSALPVELTTAPILDKENNIRGYIAIIRKLD
ncbi:PAS domain S-box protein [Candidatus Saganbacteria bacterium]|nr:PAS domain S-box protein [Candidatus Saganbacteria bacterium]